MEIPIMRLYHSMQSVVKAGEQNVCVQAREGMIHVLHMGGLAVDACEDTTAEEVFEELSWEMVVEDTMAFRLGEVAP